MKRFLLFSALTTGLALAAAGNVHAQGLSIALRGGGGLPIGQFAESSSGSDPDALLAGARTGFGLGLEATFSFSRTLGLYAGFDRVAFDCALADCGSEGDYELSGVTAGVKVSPLQSRTLNAWLRGGVTFHELQGGFSKSDQVGKLVSDRAPGFEVGAGADVPVLGLLHLSPQVRYVGQYARLRIPGVDAPEVKENVGYITLDLGLGFGFPFRGTRR